MRFIVMHKTIPAWEANEAPSRELVEKVGALIGDLQKSGAMLAGEGLRASSEGVRIRRTGGATTTAPGPFLGGNELPAGFTLLRAATLGEAVDWASRQAEALGDGAEIDVRPLTEAWDIGMVPKPETLTSRRYMALRKATPQAEAGEAPSTSRRDALRRLDDELKERGSHLGAESLAPSRRGRRYKNSEGGLRVVDGPFAESKELIAGYVLIDLPSLDDADPWVRRYMDVVGTREVDLREVSNAPW